MYAERNNVYCMCKVTWSRAQGIVTIVGLAVIGSQTEQNHLLISFNSLRLNKPD